MTPPAAAHVVIAYDASDQATHAIETVARLVPGARATVVTVRESWSPDEAAGARVALPDAVIVPAIERLDRELARAAAETAERGRDLAAAAGLTADAEVEAAATPWLGLVAAARRLRAAAIACGTSGRGGVARALLGTTTDALLDHAPVPVLVIPPEDAPHDGPLVIGYDRSEPARLAIGDAARLFAGRRALVVHAWSSPARRSFAGSTLLDSPVDEVAQLARGLDDLLAADAEELAEEGAALAREAGLHAAPRTLEASHGTWRALADAAAAEGAAVVVAGSRGRGALASSVLGSVSSGLAHNAGRPVLISRHP